MSTLSAAITFADLEVPAGTVVASYEAVLSDGQVAVFTAEAPSASFTVAAGKYSVIVRALAADGSQIGVDVTSNEVEVIDVPTTITVSVPAAVVLTIAA